MSLSAILSSVLWHMADALYAFTACLLLTECMNLEVGIIGDMVFKLNMFKGYIGFRQVRLKSWSTFLAEEMTFAKSQKWEIARQFQMTVNKPIWQELSFKKHLKLKRQVGTTLWKTKKELEINPIGQKSLNWTYLAVEWKKNSTSIFIS